MPKTDIDYSNTVFYKIYCKDINFHDVYIGHTTNFVQRKHAHKRACNKSTEQSHNLKVYKIIRERGGWDNWNMEIIGFKNCKDHSDACTVEQEYFDSYEASLNSILAKKSIIERLPIAKEKLDLYCEVCKIKCSCTKSFERHKKTKKHVSLEKTQNNAEISTSKDKSPYNLADNLVQKQNMFQNFYCKSCHYSTCRKSQYERHLSTSKHKKLTNADILVQDTNSKHICSCGKEFGHRQSLHRHKQNCSGIQTNTVSATTTPVSNTNDDLVNVIVKQQEETSELKKLLIEQSQQIHAQQKQIQELIPQVQKHLNVTLKTI